MVFHDHDGLVDVFKIPPFACTVFFQCQIHLFFDADIIHDQTLFFAFKLAIDPRNGLYQVVLLDGWGFRLRKGSSCEGIKLWMGSSCGEVVDVWFKLWMEGFKS